MQLTPRYGDPPALVMDKVFDDPAGPLLRQRRRLGDVLASFSDDQWRGTSRCDGWTVADVVAHLVGTNQFWAISLAAGLRSEPTRFLATFDPVSSPPAMIQAFREQSPRDVLAQYTSSVDELAAVVEGMDDAAWETVAESPPGHVAAHVVALHALWDAWIHERDILLPLGLEHTLADDEVIGCLHYVAAVGPSFLAAGGSTRRGSLTVTATAPTAMFTVDAGSTVVVRSGDGPSGGARLNGDAVALVERDSATALLSNTISRPTRCGCSAVSATSSTSRRRSWRPSPSAPCAHAALRQNAPVARSARTPSSVHYGRTGRDRRRSDQGARISRAYRPCRRRGRCPPTSRGLGRWRRR